MTEMTRSLQVVLRHNLIQCSVIFHTVLYMYTAMQLYKRNENAYGIPKMQHLRKTL